MGRGERERGEGEGGEREREREREREQLCFVHGHLRSSLVGVVLLWYKRSVVCSVVSNNLCVMMSVSGAGGVLCSYKGGREPVHVHVSVCRLLCSADCYWPVLAWARRNMCAFGIVYYVVKGM